MTLKLGLTLGSKPFEHGALALDSYLHADAPAVPIAVSAPGNATYAWGMLGNDDYGDCVPAALFHIDESLYLRRALNPYPYQAPEALALYFAANGVAPGPAGSSSDQGTDPAVAMAYWQSKGLPGHKLAGWGALPPTSPNIRRAVWEFGAVLFCVALPDNWQSQVDASGVAHWRGTQTPDQNEGHGICVNGFTPDLFRLVSWGQEGDADDPWAASCLEQVYVPLSTDALNSADVGPAGFAFAQMRADLPSGSAA